MSREYISIAFRLNKSYFAINSRDRNVLAPERFRLSFHHEHWTVWHTLINLNIYILFVSWAMSVGDGHNDNGRILLFPWANDVLRFIEFFGHSVNRLAEQRIGNWKSVKCWKYRRCKAYPIQSPQKWKMRNRCPGEGNASFSYEIWWPVRRS